MASQEVHALIVVEGSSIRRDCLRASQSQREACAGPVVREALAASGSRGTPRALTARPRSRVAAARIDQSYRKTVLAFLAFMALSVCGSIHHVAKARAVGLSTHADFAQSYGDDLELGRLAHAPARYGPESRVPPGWEIRALESEGSEEEARLDAPASTPTVRLAAILAAASPFLRRASVAWIGQLFGSSALPRGPPSIRC